LNCIAGQIYKIPYAICHKRLIEWCFTNC